MEEYKPELEALKPYQVEFDVADFPPGAAPAKRLLLRAQVIPDHRPAMCVVITEGYPDNRAEMLPKLEDGLATVVQLQLDEAAVRRGEKVDTVAEFKTTKIYCDDCNQKSYDTIFAEAGSTELGKIELRKLATMGWMAMSKHAGVVAHCLLCAAKIYGVTKTD